LGDISYNAKIVKGSSTLHPLEVTVKQILTEEPWSSDFLLTKEDGDNLSLGDTVSVYLAANSSEHHVFSGVIEKKTLIYPEDKQYPRTKFTAMSRGAVLMKNNFVQKEVPEGQASLQIYKIIEDLIPGTISAFDCGYTSQDLPAISGKINNYWDLVSDVIKKVDWDFYVDQGDTLHAFPRGIETSPLVLDASDYLFRLELEEDASNIINKLEVIGGPYNTITLSYDSSNWSGPNKTTGSGNGRGYIRSDSSGEPYLIYSFSSIDLRYGRKLRLGLSYRAFGITEGTLTIRYTFFTDNDNYFKKEVKYPGGYARRTALGGKRDFPVTAEEGFYIDMWRDLEVPLNLEDPEWSEIFSPKWQDISSLEVRVLSPLGSNNYLYLSSVSILENCHYCYEDTDSQSNFGVRSGKPVWDENYTSNEMCKIAGSLIVFTYKDPFRSAGEVPTAYNFDYDLGERVTLSILGHSEVYEVRGIRHEYQEGRLQTYLKLATRYKPSIEDILDFYKKSLTEMGWDLERWKRKAQETGLIDTRSDLIDWSQVGDMFPEQFYLWSGLKILTEISTNTADWEKKTGGYEATLNSYFNELEWIRNTGSEEDDWWEVKEEHSLRVHDTIAWSCYAEIKGSVTPPLDYWINLGIGVTEFVSTGTYRLGDWIGISFGQNGIYGVISTLGTGGVGGNTYSTLLQDNWNFNEEYQIGFKYIHGGSGTIIYLINLSPKGTLTGHKLSQNVGELFGWAGSNLFKYHSTLVTEPYTIILKNPRIGLK